MDDPARTPEPGKIPHEVRAGKLAALGTGLPYYALGGRWDVTARAGTVAVEPAAGYSIG